MAGLFRSLFRSKKSRKENKENTNEDDYIVFQPCPQSTLSRQRTARFADDCMLPATAAYHTKSAPKLKKGPQSCPGGSRGGISRRTSSRQTFDIDSGHDSQSSSVRHSRSQNSVYSDEDDVENNERVEMFERKSQYYMQKYEESERHRREERRKQERLEHERNSIQNAMSNMAYCMASVQQIEKLKSERDQYKKEMSRYRTKCEKLENKFEQLETMSPNYGGFQTFPNPMQPSPYQTPQYPAPLSYNYPNPLPTIPTGPPLSSLHRSQDFMNKMMPPPQLPPNFGGLLPSNRHGGSMSFAMSNTPTTIGSEGAGESLVNPSDISFIRASGSGAGGGKASSNFYDNDEEDEIKNYRYEDDAFLAPSPLSDLTQSTSNTH
ncbi:hypothetical protein CRE_07816 [Caenorhabditis remanei]|uniref:Uncharacterized protein n=1 Tax=Caenorhabditis remanei TaxID=31234 RepID=E3NEL1_CAERE|nr:hypothetical protein CRE_07816 [Caenorhabditis remanei]